MKTVPDRGNHDAGCPASRLLVKALEKAIAILSWEFGTPQDLSVSGVDCLAIRQSWEKNVVVKLEHFTRSGRRQRRLTSALKSCKRLFDVPCFPCDAVATSNAVKDWMSSACKSVPPEIQPSAVDLNELRLAVRENISGWGRRLKESRAVDKLPVLGEYVPDQQGCYERTQAKGGTLAVPDSESEQTPVNRLRLGTAKTKGKVRVVTMQSARVKSVLTPIHNALYNHITSFGWCVRGDVKKEDFAIVASDLRDGEMLVSGDYEAATDNIFLCAVEVIVDEIAKAKELTEEEREVLVGSFRDIEVKLTSCPVGEHHRIMRGSMMGNLVSFPILCLLNKSCFDIACNIRDLNDRTRKGRFNGDDCMFAGDSAFVASWRAITKRYGLIVNEKKTGVSRRWVELNSQPYDVKRGSCPGKPVLSFLLPLPHQTTNMLTGVLKGTESFSRSVTKRILGLMRYEIAARGVLGDLPSLSPYWRKVLVKFRWFRAAAIFGGASVLEVGVKRALPVEVGPPPFPRYLGMVTRLSCLAQRENVKEWKGVKPRKVYRQKLDMYSFQSRWKEGMPQHIALRRFAFIGFEWAFVWPKSVLRVVRRDFPFVLVPRKDCIRAKWFEDHPFLTRRPRVVEVGKVRVEQFSIPPSLFVEEAVPSVRAFDV